MTYYIPYLIGFQSGVMSGGCKGALLRIQFRYTAVFLFPMLIRGWNGSQIGLFSPAKTSDDYRCTGFYFEPWLAPDIAAIQLPRWYVKAMRFLSVRTRGCC